MSKVDSIFSFPVELFHEILSYLSCCHILRAFNSINNHIDNILIGYNNYILDLSSFDIQKYEFDCICTFLRPDQIIGLKLGKTNFNLVNRFLSSFPNSQPFTRLRSLWINNTIIVDDLLMSQLVSSINFNQLISIRFDRSCLTNSSVLLPYSFESLSKLVACSSEQFTRLSKEIPSHLTYLHMFFNSIADMTKYLRPNMHHLKSLGIGIKINFFETNQFVSVFRNYKWRHLIQFNLNLNVNADMDIVVLEQILSSMHQLKYLTLILQQPLSTRSNILSGSHWRRFLSRSLIFLKKFNFQFSMRNEPEELIYFVLNSFKTEWWLVVKKWFVEYDSDQRALITIPYFASKTFDNRHSYSFYFLQNPEIFYSNINHLNLDLFNFNEIEQLFLSQSRIQPRFTHVTQLSLNGYLTTDIVESIRNNVEFNMIKHFEFTSTVGTTEACSSLIQNMTNLCSIHMEYVYILDLFKSLLSPHLTIRHVVLLGYEASTRKNLFRHICRLFPRLTHLTTDYYSRRMLCYLLKKLVHLEQLTLHLATNQYAPNHAWIARHSRLRIDSFESTVFRDDRTRRNLVLRINTVGDFEFSRHHIFKNCSIQ